MAALKMLSLQDLATVHIRESEEPPSNPPVPKASDAGEVWAHLVQLVDNRFFDFICQEQLQLRSTGQVRTMFFYRRS